MRLVLDLLVQLREPLLGQGEALLVELVLKGRELLLQVPAFLDLGVRQRSFSFWSASLPGSDSVTTRCTSITAIFDLRGGRNGNRDGRARPSPLATNH